MGEFEKEKFLVINRKRFEELNDQTSCGCGSREAMCGCFDFGDCKEVEQLKKAIEKFNKAYKERVGEAISQRYYVVNQDEPYANNILNIILKKKKVVYETQWAAKDIEKKYPHGWGFESPLVEFPRDTDPVKCADICRKELSNDEFECIGVIARKVLTDIN